MKPKFLLILAILGATAHGKPTKDATKDEKRHEEAKAAKKADARDVCDNFVPLDYWFEAKELKGASKPGAAAKLRAKAAGCPVGTKLACQFKPAQCVLEEKPKARTFHDWQKHCDKFKLSLPEIVPYEMEMTGKIVKEIYANKKLKGHEWIWLNVKVVEKESESKAQWLTSMETFPQELTEIDKIEHHPKYKPGDCVAYHAEGHFVPLDCKTKLVSACFLPLKTTMIPKGSLTPKHPHHKEHDHKGNPKAKRNSAVEGKLFKDFDNEHEKEEDEEKKPQSNENNPEKPEPAPKIDRNAAVLNSEQKPKPEAKMETKTEKDEGKEVLEEEDEPVGFGLKNVPEVLRPTFIPASKQNEVAKNVERKTKNSKFAPDEVDELEEAVQAAASSRPPGSRSPAGSTPAPEALKTKLPMTTVKPRSGQNGGLRMERQGDENLPEDHQERAIAGVGPETDPESSGGSRNSTEAPEASKLKLLMTSVRPGSARSGNLRSMERPGDENLPEDYEERIKPENTDASEKSSNPQKSPQEGKDDEKEEDEDVKNLFGLDDDDVASNSTGGSNLTVNRTATEFEPKSSRAPKQRNASWDAIASGREKQIPSASTILLSTPNLVTTPRNDTQVVAGPPASQNQSETKNDTSQRPLAFGPVGGARFFDANNSEELSKSNDSNSTSPSLDMNSNPGGPNTSVKPSQASTLESTKSSSNESSSQAVNPGLSAILGLPESRKPENSTESKLVASKMADKTGSERLEDDQEEGEKLEEDDKSNLENPKRGLVSGLGLKEAKPDTPQPSVASNKPVVAVTYPSTANPDDATTVSKRTVVIWVTGIRYVTKPRRG